MKLTFKKLYELCYSKHERNSVMSRKSTYFSAWNEQCGSPRASFCSLKLRFCRVFKTQLQRPEMRVSSCLTLGGACPETCVRPRFPPPVSYLAYEIHFDTLTHAPRVATEVDGRCLTFGKGSESRSGVILLLRLLLLFDIHMSVHRNVIPNYSQQDATFLDLFIFTDALHVSGGSSAHHQEHITVHTASGIVNQYCC
jgi:hypothetical protein